jgi:hypothetical protein
LRCNPLTTYVLNAKGLLNRWVLARFEKVRQAEPLEREPLDRDTLDRAVRESRFENVRRSLRLSL